MTSYARLPGLPPYGPPARPVPADWGRLGREGVVVEFRPPAGPPWVGNFAPGAGGLSDVLPHPDGRRVLVVAGGDAWAVDPGAQAVEPAASGVGAVWPVPGTPDLVLGRDGLAFVRLGPGGLVWHTRRLSWDGLDKVRVEGGRLLGEAWSPLDDRWHPFEVDLTTGASAGGSFGSTDSERWERLAPAPPAA